MIGYNWFSPGGYVAAIKAAQLNMSVLVIEKRFRRHFVSIGDVYLLNQS